MSTVLTGCALAVLWIGGGALTLWIALAVAIGPYPCGGTGEPECGGSSAVPVLVGGFGFLALVTVLVVVLHHRRSRNVRQEVDASADGPRPSPS
jgi:hypothetical protein